MKKNMNMECIYKSPVIKAVTLQNGTGLMAMSQAYVYGSSITNWVEEDGYDEADY